MLTLVVTALAICFAMTLFVVALEVNDIRHSRVLRRELARTFSHAVFGLRR